MKLKNVLDLPSSKSYIRCGADGYIDFDDGSLVVESSDEFIMSKKATKALFTSMLMHYMANGDTDIFEMEG